MDRALVRRLCDPRCARFGIRRALDPVGDHQGRRSASQIGTAVAAQNIGALSAPIWGALADRTRAYRAIFFSGFLIIGVGFVGFSLLSGIGAWKGAAYLIGFGTGASNTVASLFIVEFTPQSEWSQRISWLQTFNAAGSVLGMAAAGLLMPRFGMMVAALLALPAIAIGGIGLPVPSGRLHFPHILTGKEIAALVRHGGPNAAAVYMQRASTYDFASTTHGHDRGESELQMTGSVSDRWPD